MQYKTQVDIGNRAAQHIGAKPMGSAGFSEVSKLANQVSFVYDKLRQSELQQNTWRFAIYNVALRPIDANTAKFVPSLWVQATTYFKGSVVADANGYLWESRIASNVGNDPLLTTNFWEPYFKPLTVALYDSTVAYFSGELVYTIAGDGTYNVFTSLQDGNAIHPALPNQWLVSAAYNQNQVVQLFPNWAVGTTYTQGQGVLYTDGNVYVSLTNGNVGNTPTSSGTNWQLMPFLQLATPIVPANGPQPTLTPTTTPIGEWSSTTGYSLGNFAIFNATVYMSIANNNTANYPNVVSSTFWIAVTNGTLYMSLVDFNIGNNPASSPTQWTSSFTQGGGNDYWLQIGGSASPSGVSLQAMKISWPVGAGPLNQSFTRNVFRLPSNFLRKAPQDDKAGSFSVLGAPSNLNVDDWEYRGDFLTSWSPQPIIFPFVADVVDVTKFDEMFCEGLAAKIGEAICQPMTQSSTKQAVCRAEYDKYMGRAKLANAILVGAEQPPLDDWLACRI